MGKGTLALCPLWKAALAHPLPRKAGKLRGSRLRLLPGLLHPISGRPLRLGKEKKIDRR